ncbi:MAG TPA: DegT/DnrJ/EryC1/StrS family aminotransferase [Chloroflexota bacterium]|nr:DegT/DnrJ/EryC1/StrS family aminotransferase [Chloroflexota bacterium]
MTASPTTRRNVPFNVLKPGVDAIRAELDAAIARVLDSGWFLQGPELAAFEHDFAAYHSPDMHAVGVASGTDAITLALRAVGVQPGDEVLVPANAGVPPVAATVAAGAVPVFCDVDPRTHGLDPTDVGRRITPRSRAVLVVHLYGQPAQVEALTQLASMKEVLLVEDCAQAHGATINGQKVGTFGDAAAFSFYPTKNLGALGDGGAVLTRDPHAAETARRLRVYGWRERYVSQEHSTVSRLGELQAALLSVKLRHLDAWNAGRRSLAQRYRSRLDGIVALLPPDGVFHLFVIRTSHRDTLRDFLRERGVASDVHYPLPTHLQTPYAHYGAGAGSLPITESLAQEVLSLPLYPELSDDDVEYVAGQVCAFVAQHGA